MHIVMTQAETAAGKPNIWKKPPMAPAKIWNGVAGDDEGDDAEHGLDEHRAIANRQHILLIGHGLGGRAGGNEAVETGNGTAGDRDEQNWEQALALDLEANESRHVEHRVRDDDADDTAEDHAQKQEGTQTEAIKQ